MAIWEKDELEREQVRGLFAIAVLASIAAYLVSRGSFKPLSLPTAAPFFALLDAVSVILLMFWTLYVVTVAISMTFWAPRRRFPFVPILKWFKSASQYCFYLGSFTSLIFVAIFVPQILYLQFTIFDPTTRLILIVLLVLSVGSYVGLRIKDWLGGRGRAAASGRTGP